MTDKTTKRERKPRPPLFGFAIVADFWLWGALLLYAPAYFNITGGWRTPFNVLGFIAITISFAGALTEIGNLWKSEGLSYWGASLVFLLPAVLLHVVVIYYTLTPPLVTIAKIAVLILVAIGGGLFFQGVPYLLWKTKEKQEPEQVEEVSPEQAAERKATKRKVTFEAVARILIALLSLATAVVKLVLEVIR